MGEALGFERREIERVGLNATGATALANGFSGTEVGMGASGNTIGGGLAGAGNVLSGNTYQGIYINGVPLKKYTPDDPNSPSRRMYLVCSSCET